jgi:hypothetical protein
MEPWSDIEESFFRRGECEPAIESWDDLEDDRPPPSFWSRVLGRQPRARTTPQLDDDENEDAGQWETAIARARAAAID